MSNPFDFINDLSSNKKNLIENADDPESMEKAYPAFMVNRGFSYFIDTILYANEMNQCSHIDNKLQHDYYFNSIRPKKRFSKWHKASADSVAELISEAYGINIQRAKEYASLLSEQDINDIKTTIIKGGRE